MLKVQKDRLEEGEPPTKKLITEKDVLIKEYAAKQLNVKISLEEQLSNRKEFCKGYQDIPLEISGKCSLDMFKESVNTSDIIGKLKAAGLTKTDIDIYLDSGNGKKLNEDHKNLNSTVRLERLDKINEMVKIHQSSLEKIEHDYISPPMEKVIHLDKAISNDLNCNKLSVNKIRRKARKLQRRINKSEDIIEDIQSGKQISVSKWDVKETEPVFGEKVDNLKVYTCKIPNYYTIKDGNIVKIEQDESRKTLEYKITYEENTEQNEEIIPSKKLYLKNLPRSINEEKLLELIKNYGKCNDIIKINLMKGRMKGQAFVNFSSVDFATNVLIHLKGICINGKPLVIEYAKSTEIMEDSK